MVHQKAGRSCEENRHERGVVHSLICFIHQRRKLTAQVALQHQASLDQLLLIHPAPSENPHKINLPENCLSFMRLMKKRMRSILASAKTKTASLYETPFLPHKRYCSLAAARGIGSCALRIRARKSSAFMKPVTVRSVRI